MENTKFKLLKLANRRFWHCGSSVMKWWEFFMLAETRRLALKACCAWCQGRMVAFRYSGSAAKFRTCWRETCMTAWFLDLAVVLIGFRPGMHSRVAQEIWLHLTGCSNVLAQFIFRYSLRSYLKDSSVLKSFDSCILQVCCILKWSVACNPDLHNQTELINCYLFVF